MSHISRLWAPAKVNLFLHVGSARPDGRHDLDSLVVFAGSEAADVLTIEAAASFSLSVRGETAPAAGPIEDNLVWRAVRDMEAVSGRELNYSVILEKNLPVAAGIGGGSADAGAAMRALSDSSRLDVERLLGIAARLGGDVPAALLSAPCLMRGDGERVKPVSDLPIVSALLVNPGVACPTGAVFKAYDEQGGGSDFRECDLPDLADGPSLIAWLAGETRNDLEAPARRLVPEVGRVLSALEVLSDARLVRMTGSGATCFALFDTPVKAASAEIEILSAHPGWWTRATTLGDGA